MIKYRTKLIDRLVHGQSVSNIIKTTDVPQPPEVVTCFGSYKVHTRPLIDRNVDTPDGAWQAIKLYFTYSRNGGPIQRVMIDENTEDWNAIDLLYSKLDSDLCRAQDGESLAFYLLSDNMGVAEQVIPELNNIHLPPVLLPPIEVAQMTMASVPEQPDYDYTITGIGGDGLIPIPNVFNIDSRNISIPHPYSTIDPETVDWSAWPRWYPNNTIVKEDNTIVIYPSEGIEPHDFDLFRALGGVDNTPITINSCVKAVPRKYSCEASHVVGSQVSPLILASLALAESDVQPTVYREPIRFSDTPFPFKAASWSGDYLTWPPSIYHESGTREYDWIASYRRNDGPLKVITWNTGSRKPGSQHSVWDAIKELLLDDYGRTAFMLSDFNSTASSFNGDGDVTVKSGIGSNLNFTTKPPVEGDPLHQSNQPYRYSGKSVEVRDRQIQFSDENAGAVWNENTITIYPTPLEVINDYGFDGQSDYYEYLCQYYDQLEAGEPITIHSCAAVEPADHVQVNTGFKIDMSAMGEVMPPGLIARVQINDGEIKEFANEGEFMEKTMIDLLNYVTFLGANPIVTSINSGINNDAVPLLATQSKTNLLYFKTTIFGSEPVIEGCSGIERPNDPRMGLVNIDMEAQKMELLQVEILDDMNSDIPHVRGSNKVTFHRAVGSEYVDFFDLIVGAKGDTHTIYSSAGIPCLLHVDPVDDGGEPPIEPEPVDGDLSGIEPFTFTNVSKPDTTGITKFDIGMSNTDGYWEIRESGQLIASPNHRADGVGFDSNRDDYRSIVIYNMNGVTRDFEVYVRASTVSVRIESLYTTPGDVELNVTSFGNVSPKMIFRVGNGIVYLPETFPPHITDCEGMFNNGHNIGSDITGWDMSNVTNMAFMFADCRAFNQDISGWDVSNVTQMNSMFWAAYKFNQDLSTWCVSNIPSYPNGFASEANAWTLPKPVWGTCPKEEANKPDGTPLKFTVNNPDNLTGDMPFKVNLTTFNSDYTWSIYKDGKLFVDADTIPEDVHVRDDNYFAGVSTYSTSVTLPMERNTINEYLIYSDVNSVEITSDGEPDEINPRVVTVLEFSDSIAEHLFPSNYILFTVPDELPSYLRSTKSMFFNNKLFNQDISTWDTSNIVDMGSMFSYAASFNQDIGNWDVSNVTNMDDMFTGATSFNWNLSGWCVSNIPSIPRGFIYATDSWILPKPVWGTCPLAGVLTEPEIPLTFSVDTDTPIEITVSDVSIGDWKLFKNDVLIARPGISQDSSSVSINSSNRVSAKIYTINHDGLNEYKLYAEGNKVLIREIQGELTDEFTITEFSNRCKEVVVGISKANLVVTADLPPSITSTLGMFRYCELFNSDISHWDVSNVTNMDYMFHYASTFNQDLSKWCVSNIPSLPLGFDLEATAWMLPRPVWGTCPVNVKPLDFNVESSEYGGFYLTIADTVGDWSVLENDVIKLSGSDAIYEELISELTPGSTNIKIIAAADYIKIGYTDSAHITKLTVNDFGDTVPNVRLALQEVPLVVPESIPTTLTILDNMFHNSYIFNQDISMWDTSHVTSMRQMFGNAKFNQDISMWDTSNVTDMGYMFGSARNFDQDISNWNVGQVTDMSDMFGGAEVFNQPIGNWDVSKVVNMRNMFFDTTLFNQPLDGWDVSNVTYMGGMFNIARAFNQDLSMWNVSNITDKPTDFDKYANVWILPRPIWGTTGKPKV